MSDTQSPSHLAFADESCYNKGRFRSLAVITMRADTALELSDELRQTLADSGISEFKWSALKTAKARFAAIKMLTWAIEHAARGQLRIDTLIWDTEDTRHRVRGRDDVANLQRMYHHLFKNVLRMRWPAGTTWKLCPDENMAVVWDDVKEFLATFGTELDLTGPIVVNHRLIVTLRRLFQIEDIVPCCSHEQPLVQLADLFAGLAAFSYEKFEAYRSWAKSSSTSISPIADTIELPIRLSNSDRERFSVLAECHRMCGARKLGVSLLSSCGLRTRNPAKPVNFWLYVAQHQNDRAPVKQRRDRR